MAVSGDLTGVRTDYASFGQRFVAWFVDGIIVFIIAAILSTILGRTTGGGISLLASLVYFTAMIGSSMQATIGMNIMKIQVVSADGETGPIGYVRAFIRWLISYIAWFVLIVGGLIDNFWMLWDPQKQTIHDKVANTLVVRTR